MPLQEKSSALSASGNHSRTRPPSKFIITCSGKVKHAECLAEARIAKQALQAESDLYWPEQNKKAHIYAFVE